MKIGIVALGKHDYMLPDFIQVAKGHDLEVFTTPRAESEINSQFSPHNITIYSDSEPTPDQIDLIFQRATSLDCLLVLTMHKPLFEIQWLKKKPDVPQIAWMHRANEYTLTTGLVERLWQIFLTEAYTHLPMPRLMTPIIRRSRRYLRPAPLDRFDTVMVNHDPMKDYLEKNGWGNPIKVFRPAVYGGSSSNEADPPLHIVVPGDINGNNRDYSKFLDECVRVWRDFGEEFKVTLLGGSQNASPDLRQRCSELSSKNNLFWYPDSDWISEDEFSDTLKSADMLALPTHQIAYQKHTFGPAPKWGISVGSGVPLEAIKYGLPVLIPEHYPTGDLEGILQPVESYSQYILELLESKSKQKIIYKEAARKASAYDISSQRDRFTNIVRETIDAFEND